MWIEWYVFISPDGEEEIEVCETADIRYYLYCLEWRLKNIYVQYVE